MKNFIHTKSFVVIILLCCLLSGCASTRTTTAATPVDLDCGDKPSNANYIVNNNIKKYMQDHHPSETNYRYYIDLKDLDKESFSKDIAGWHGRIAVNLTPKKSYDKSRYLLIDYYINNNKIYFKEKYSSGATLAKGILALGTLGLSQVATGNVLEEDYICIDIIKKHNKIEKKRKEQEAKIQREQKERDRQYALKHIPHVNIDAFKVRYTKEGYNYYCLHLICLRDSITIYDIVTNKGNLRPTSNYFPIKAKYGNIIDFGVVGDGIPILVNIFTNAGIASYTF